MSARLKIKVVPRSSQEKIVDVAPGELKVYVHSAPANGKANESIRRLLAERFNVPKTAVRIVKGETSRDKVIEIN
ncbi:MAG: DUF167 domain-containing protein [Candidatus Omnitrophica bacterium]|nr:DUF167 domain-containing protein [Candidatus Omnitrophota bacterium]